LKSIILNRLLALIAAAMVLLPGFFARAGQDSSRPDVTIRPARPRVLLTGDDFYAGKRLQSKCYEKGLPTEDFAKILNWSRAKTLSGAVINIDNPEESMNEMQVLAFCHLMTPKDRAFGARAVQIAVELSRMEGVRNPSFMWRRLPCALSIVFDWCNDVLTDRDRQMLKYDLLKRGIYIRERINADEFPYYHDSDRIIPLAYIVAGLGAEEKEDGRLREWAGYCRQVITKRIIPAREKAAPDGSWCERNFYNRSESLNIAELLEVWFCATGENYFLKKDAAGEKPFGFLKNTPLWVLYSTKPDFSSFKNNDSAVERPAVPAYHLNHLAMRYRDRHARWLADRFEQVESEEAAPERVPGAERMVELFLNILFKDALLEPSSPLEDNLKLSRHFSGAGQVFIRSGWDFGSESKDIFASFVCETYPGRTRHLQQNSFTIARGSDRLIVDSGFLDWGAPSHLKDYFRRTIAHNTILPNLKGQKKLTARNRLDWMDSPAAFRGTISAYAERGTYVYAVGNAGRAYREKDLREFTRQFVYLREAEAFVIFDRLFCPRNDFLPVWVIHSNHEPAASGDESIIEGKRGFGIFRYAASDSILIRQGKSKLEVKRLFPKEAAVRKIGGDGYEFFVAGENKMLSKRMPPEIWDAEEIGRWRIEAFPRKAGSEQAFLNVLSVGDAASALESISSRAAREEDKMWLFVRKGKLEYVIHFDLVGPAGGSIAIKKDGKQVLSEVFVKEDIEKIRKVWRK